MSDPENVNGTPGEEQEGLRISDKRRFDPQTFQRRQPAEPTGPAEGDQVPAGGEPAGQELAAAAAEAGQEAETEAEAEAGEVPGDFVVPDDLSGLETDTRVEDLENQVRERTGDLQRLQAEYVNYKRRVDRDRELVVQNATYKALAPIVDVLDNIDRAREHAPLEDGFKAVAEQLERTVANAGLTKFGEPGEVFDPTLHEALSHLGTDPEVSATTVKVLAKAGYRIGDRVVRAAQVLVVDPE